MPTDRPKIGVGVILIRDGKVLLMKRTSKHAPSYSIPGGHLEVGETFEQAAIREVNEECGLLINNPRVIAVTNNLDTFVQEGVHTVSVILLSEDFQGEPTIMEPEKCEALLWADPVNLPEPHFDASRQGIACYLEGKFY